MSVEPKATAFVPPRIDTTQPPVEDRREPIFYIDDREFTVPVEVSAATALRAIKVFADQGVYASADFMIENGLGDEAYQALVDCPQATLDDLSNILGQLGKKYLGQIEKAVGKRGSGSGS